MGELLNEVNETLKNYYYNVEEDSSFSNAQILFKKAKKRFPNLKLTDVKEWLNSQDVHQISKRPKRVRTNPIVSKTIDHIWQADLVEIKNFKENDNIKYLLVCIDNLSKFLWVRKLVNKKKETILTAFDDIISRSGSKPHILSTDSGSEFRNFLFKNYCKDRKIHQFMVKAPRKAYLAERVIQTIEGKIQKYLLFHDNLRFIDVIDKIVLNYNNTRHSRTHFKPIDVTHLNEREVFQHLYKKRHEMEAQLFEVGDRVRVSERYFFPDLTKVVNKKLLKKFSREIYIVDKIIFTSPRYRYLVRDIEGNLLDYSFYADELIKVPK